MPNDNVIKLSLPGTFEDQLTEVLRSGAQTLLAKAVEAEVAGFLAKHAGLKTNDGLARVVQTHDPEYICGVAGNAALTAFSQSLGSVSPKDGIRVVSINPGPVATERLVGLMRKKAQDRTGDAENWQDLVKPLPFGRAATSEEIGAMIAFAASEHSNYTSGSVVIIDGGLSARAQAF